MKLEGGCGELGGAAKGWRGGCGKLEGGCGELRGAAGRLCGKLRGLYEKLVMGHTRTTWGSGNSDTSALAEPSWALAHTELALLSTRGRHIGPQEALQDRPGAPQAVVGNVPLLYKRQKVVSVHADQAGVVGLGHSTMGNAQGVLVEPGIGVEGVTKNG